MSDQVIDSWDSFVTDLFALLASADRACIILEKGDERQLVNVTCKNKEDDHA